MLNLQPFISETGTKCIDLNLCKDISVYKEQNVILCMSLGDNKKVP